MKLVFLGTGGFHPTDRRHTSCAVIPQCGLVLDAGTGLYRLPRFLDDFPSKSIDVLLSHAHLDHICGLTYLLVPMYSKQLERVRIIGEQSKLDAVRNNLFAEPVFPIHPEFEYVPFTDNFELQHGGTVSAIEQEHPGGSLGYRIDFPGASLAYLTDTTVQPQAAEFVDGVDLLIHEANFLDGQEDWAATTGHSTPKPACELARSAAAKRLYLSHFDPERPVDELPELAPLRKIFPETHLAEDLLEVEFGVRS